MANPHAATLTVDGTVFTGWEKITVQRSIEAAAGAFSFTVSQEKPWPIVPGKKAVVSLGGVPMITGWIDKASIQLSESSHTITVSGRDTAGDLVDCAVEHPSGEFVGQTLMQIATAVCKPFGITVAAKTATGGAFPKFAVQPGESAWQCLERLARQRGVLLVSDGLGGVQFIQPGAEDIGVALVEGENIKSASADFDDQERFSKYIVRGQATGSDDGWGDAAAKISASATDPNITRYRPTIVLSEGNTTSAIAKTRALFEASVRAARAAKFTVQVAGWKISETGGLWLPNKLVTCKVPTLDLDGKMLISSIEYSQDSNSGTNATLSLARPAAFQATAITKKSDEGKSASGPDTYGSLFK